MIVDKEDGNRNNAKIKRIRLSIIFIALELVITEAALLPSYDLGQVVAQQAGNNTKLSLSAPRQ
jgi:hypothetical protein